MVADLPEQVDESCAAWLGLWLDRPAGEVFRPEVGRTLRGDDVAARGSLGEIGPLRRPRRGPPLVVGAGDDDLIPPALTADLVARLAARGVRVDQLVLPDAEHLLLPSVSRHEALAWIHGL